MEDINLTVFAIFSFLAHGHLEMYQFHSFRRGSSSFLINMNLAPARFMLMRKAEDPLFKASPLPPQLGKKIPPGNIYN